MSVTEFAGTDGATRANFNAKIQQVNTHIADTVAHMTQDQKNQLASAVPNTRKVNGHALSADVTVTAADVGALPSNTNVVKSRDAHSINILWDGSVLHMGVDSTDNLPVATAADTTSINSALTVSTSEPPGTLSPGKLWGVY